MSSLEALSLGRAVIAGLDDWNLATIRTFVGDAPLPWRIARDTRELRQRLVELAQDPALRRETGAASRRFMALGGPTPTLVDALNVQNVIALGDPRASYQGLLALAAPYGFEPEEVAEAAIMIHVDLRGERVFAQIWKAQVGRVSLYLMRPPACRVAARQVGVA